MNSADVSHGVVLSPRVALLVFVRDKAIFVLWAVIAVFFSFWCMPYFATWSNAVLIASAAATTAIFAAAVGVGIMTGVLDLSLPGTAALASCVAGLMMTSGIDTWISLAAGIGCGVVVGLVDGLIVIRGFNPIVVTIAALSVLSGLAAIVSQGRTFYGLQELKFMGTDRYFGVPAPVFIVVALYIVGTVFLTRTRDGVRLMAVGGNAEAVRRSGIKSGRYMLVGFMISGFCAALGGLVGTAVTLEASPTASTSIIFTAITAVVLAGTPLTGGRGSLPRVLVGALILETISNGLTIRGVQPYWATVVTGLLLIGSIVFERVIRRAISARLMSENISVHAGRV